MRGPGSASPRVAVFLAVLAAVALLNLVGCAAPKRVGGAAAPGGPAPAPGAGGPVLLRVLVAEDRPGLLVSCSGAWSLQGGSRESVALALAPGDTLLAQDIAGDVLYTCGRQRGRSPRLVLRPQDPDDCLLLDGRAWRGELSLMSKPADGVSGTGGRGLMAINMVELECYLAGVVPLEIGARRSASELAAVAAQAIVARTYAVARRQAGRGRGFDLYADDRDQVYGGVAGEDSLCTAAIAATAGLVLAGAQSLAPTYYHSTCGGHTAAVAAVWPTADDPLLRGVADRRPDGLPWCAESRYAQWREQWTWSELQSILARTLPAYLDYVRQPGRAAWANDAFRPASGSATGRDPGALIGLSVAARTREGRVAVLEIETAAGRYHVRGDQTRRVLRPDPSSSRLLRSAWFDLEVAAGRQVTAAGRGWGHGLGLCQVGALARARAGQSAAAILTHYYPGTRLVPLAGAPLP